MKKQIFGIVVSMLMISMLFSASGAINIKELNDKTSEEIVYLDDSIFNTARSDRDFSIYYVNDYCGSGSDLWLCDNDASFIYNRLKYTVDTPWENRYYKSSYSADGKYWQDSYENTYIDRNDLVIFRGHGSSCSDSFWGINLRGLSFRCDADDTCFTPGDAYDRYGDRDLEWIVLGCCSPLADSSRGYWAATMDGMHLILGYKNSASHVTYGESWIRYCTSIGSLDPAHRVIWSWFKACNVKQGSGVISRVVGETTSMKYDYLWGEGSVQSDPTDDIYYTYWTHTKGNGISVPSKLPPTAEEMPLLKVIPKQVMPQDVQEIGEHFGMSGEVGDGGNYEDTYFMADGSKALRVSKVDGIDYGDSEKLWKVVESAPDLPSLKEAEEIATAFVKDTGLLPADASPGMAIFSDVMGIGKKESTEIVEEFPTDISVEFQRAIGGEYPVYGGGSSCLVYIGEGGEVTGFTKIWRDLENVGMIDIFDADTAKNLFVKYGAQITLTGIPSIVEEYEITDTVLGYYEGGFGEHQTYLIPSYLFFAKYQDGDETVEQILTIPASYEFIKPMVEIISPDDGSSYNEGDTINFIGRAAFGTQPHTYNWYSNFDGFLGTGNSIEVSDLTPIIRDGRNIAHTISLVVTDEKGRVGEASISVLVKPTRNLPPKTPVIEGADEGKTGTEYEYFAQSTDPDGDKIYYRIDIMDGEESEPTDWQGPYESGTQVSFKYTWQEDGTYSVSVQAKDEYEAESAWGSIEVTMPKSKGFGFNFNILNWLFREFPNAFPILRHLLGI